MFNDYEEIINRDMIHLAIKESEKNVQTIISVTGGRFGNPFQFEPENEETKVCSLLEWCFIISIDTCWDWFQCTYVLITAQKNL